MIGKLKGKVEEISDGHALLDVQGVCYLVFCSGKTLDALSIAQNRGEEIALFTDMHVSENDMKLCGFMDKEEQWIYRLLLSVQGISTKIALGILGCFAPQDLISLFRTGDHMPIKQAPGVGEKLAQRMLLEITPRIFPKDSKSGGKKKGVVASFVRHEEGKQQANDAAQDAQQALLQLGYAPQDASHAVALAKKKLGQEASLEECLLHALRALAPM